MLALIFDGQRLLLDAACGEPVPAAGEALVRVDLAGICGTDLEISRGYAGFSGILGHEFVGTVLACPDRPELVGERVAGEINIGCGVCQRCRAANREHCVGRTVVGIRQRAGAFAQRMTLPVENLHLVPRTLSDEAAVFTEPLAAAFQALDQAPADATDRVVVVGAGRLGQLVAHVYATSGCQLVVVSRNPQGRKMALLQAAGIATAAPGTVSDDWADVVVECTGNEAGFAAALDMVRPQGTIVLKSTYHGFAQVDLSRVVVDEIRVLGSRCGPFDKALAALASGVIDPTPMIDAIYPLSRGLEAMEHAARPDALKVLLLPD